MLPDILGPHLAEQKALIPTLAKSDGPLLILGEEGVGKSLYARHIHAAAEGPQCDLPVVNLATASTRTGWLSLLGSDFAGLTSTRRSLLERRGNILIEHINAAPLSLQAEVATALRDGWFVRPGAVRKTCVTCRAIFTLLERPQVYSANGTMAPALFDLLSSVRTIVIPPLRNRPGDISAIARQILGRFLTPELEQILLADSWLGNATELKVHLLLIRPFTGRGGPTERCLHQVRKILQRIDEGRHVSMRESISKLESTIVAYALSSTEGHKTRAAELLGLTRPALRRYIDDDPPPA